MMCAPPDEGGGIETIVVAAIGPAHRLALDGAIVGEVVESSLAARRADRVDDLFAPLGPGRSRRAVGGDRLERRGEIVEREVRRPAARFRRDADKMRADDGWLRERLRGQRAANSARSSWTRSPRGASAIAGAIRSAKVNLPEPYLRQASSRPATVPGTPMPSPLARLRRIGLAVGVEEHVLGRRRRRGLAIVDGDRRSSVGAMDEHEAAAAEIAGARQGDGEREADRDRRVDRVAAALQDVEPDVRRLRLLA